MTTENDAREVNLVIGRNLRRRRRLLGLTQQQLALKIGVRFQQIQKYECGVNRLSASRLYRLSKVLDVPLTYFFRGLEDETVTLPDDEVLSRKERAQIIEQYSHLSAPARASLLAFLKSIS